MSQILIINSSARKNSNSSFLSSYVAKGAEEKGHEVKTIEIGKLNIKPCLGCFVCSDSKRTSCVIKDDMSPLYESIQNADVLVLVSPIYWFNLCGQIKQFIDRCHPIGANVDANGITLFASKKIAAVFAYADADPFAAGVTSAIGSLKEICSYTGAKWAGAVYGSAYKEGEFVQNTALLQKAELFGAEL